MNSEWQKVKLSNIIQLKNGKKRPNSSGNIPIYGGNGILGYTNSSNFDDCVVIGRVGAYCGNVFYSNDRCWISDNAIAGISKNGSILKFLYYLLKTLDLNRMSIGTGQPLLTQGILNDIEVSIPDIDVQKKTAEILSSLDDKIELNNQINKNLEQQAQAIFKSWFIDFEPFGGVMPNDWQKGSLIDIADYLNGLAMQKYRPRYNDISLPVLKIKELRQGFCDSNSDLCSTNIDTNYIINDGDVIFSWSGTLLVDFWCGGKCGLNQHLFKVTSNKYDKWFYFFWTKYHLNKFIKIAKDKATTMGHIKREDLEKSKVLIPNSSDYWALNDILQPILDMIIVNCIENRKLSKLRDALLSKLMSGEIDVSEIEL